jgi:RNA polymerase sigma-70 factor (ECF subfamily)
MLKDCTDAELLRAEDTESAFTIIYNRYAERLYKKALVRFGNDPDARDTVQEVFISLWRNKHTIDASGTLAPYLFAALRYAVIKKIYRKARHGELVPLSAELPGKSKMTEDDLFGVKELQAVICRELNHLPVRMRQVYDLSRVEDLRTREIADRLKISEQTVKNTLTSALKRLRQKISHQ